MISFEDHTINSLGEGKYRDFFAKAFGGFPLNHLPAYITVMYEDGKEVGFASWYQHNATMMYLQYIGWLGDNKNKYSYYVQMISHLSEAGFSIMGAIANNNKIALIWALRSGFQVIGLRMPKDNPLLVEVLKAKEA